MSDIMVRDELSAVDLRRQVQSIQEAMKSLMKENEHFGMIPGTNKFTLFKSGAEKLAFMFRLAPRFVLDQTDLGNGHREYTFTVNLVHIGSERFIGQGVGSASTMESKYRYRHEGGFEILDEPIPQDYRAQKERYRSRGFGAKQVDGRWVWVTYTKAEKIENPDIADTYNTVLKMAKKRALIDAILTATAASDIFAQDLDDFPPDDHSFTGNRTSDPRIRNGNEGNGNHRDSGNAGEDLTELRVKAMKLSDDMLDKGLFNENQHASAQKSINNSNSAKALNAMNENYERQIQEASGE